MSGTRSDDPIWFATPRARRNRKPLAITLSPEALARLEHLFQERGENDSRSMIIEELILAAK